MPIPGESTNDIAAADAAAEKLAAAQRREPNLYDKPSVETSREEQLDAAFAAEPPDTLPPGTQLDAFGKPILPEGAPKPEPEKKVEEKKPDPAPEPEKKVEAAPKPVDDGKRRGLLDDLLPEPAKKDAPTATVDKAFDDVKLRSDASPKTQETFNNLKEIAKAQVAAAKAAAEKLEAERAELAAKLEEAQKAAGKPTPETEAELKELREFRVLHDVTFRPEFKAQFDGKLEANDNAIYELFKSESMRPEAIEALKKLSPEARADYIEKQVYPNLTAGQRRFVEAKILDNVNILDAKAKAVAAARSDADKILAEQRAEPAKQAEQRIRTMAAHLKPMLMKLDYLHVQEIPSTASVAEKAALEERNAFALTLQESLRNAISSDSPEDRAEAALAVPLAKYYMKQSRDALARAEKAEAELASIKKASATGGRLGRSAAPADAAPVKTSNTGEDSEDALDRLFRDNQNASGVR